MRVRPWTVFSQSLFSRALAAALRCSKVNLFMFVPSQILYTRVWLGNYIVYTEYCISSSSALVGKIKAQNTIPLHTLVICFVSRHPSVFNSHFDSLSVGLFLCQLWCSLWYMHQFHWILFLFPPLHPALSCYSQLAAGVWETHTCARKTEQHADA